MTAQGASHTVKVGVLSTVIGGIVLAALAELWPPAKVALYWLWTQVVWFGHLFIADYWTPGWLLALLSVGSLVTCIRVFARLLQGSHRNSPTFTSYTSDHFHGAKWRWEWSRQGIGNLWSFCPICDSELVYDDSSCNDILRRADPRTDFICEHCNHRLVATVKGGPKAYALSAIEREIRRKLRTGEAATNT
jgi:uncharacterized protein YlaI